MRTSVLKQSQQPGGAVISLSPLGNVFSLSRCVELKTNLREVLTITERAFTRAFFLKVPTSAFTFKNL